MGVLRAGFGRAEITPARGTRLVGYALRREPSRGQHDPLSARALVLEAGAEQLALVVLELCYVGEDVVAESRCAIAEATAIPAERVMLAATHTHSGPHDADPDSWPGGLAPRLADAVRDACERLEPARLGIGWGAIHGRSLNRRRFEDPVDPALAVFRVDAVDGRPLGAVFTFGCHPVVLGPDNLLGSGDWPGHAARAVEEHLGRGAVAIFAQAGGGDVNPLLGHLERWVSAGEPIAATTSATYYGAAGADQPRSIGDRTGGTLEQMASLGEAVADEVARVHRGIEPRHDQVSVLARSALVDPNGDPLGATRDAPPHMLERPRSARERPLEVMTIAVPEAGLILVGQPGEVFAESAVRLRRELRREGTAYPLTIAHANGWRGYLPPASAYPVGGYEVEWARAVGIGERVQERVLAAALAAARG